jgi:hypothetical protein
MRVVHCGSILAAALLLGGAPASVAAQRIRGTLYEQKVFKPVAGATVTLLTVEGGARAGPGVVTDSAGAFDLAAPTPGVYRLRVEVPGRAAARTVAAELGPGDELSLTVRLAPDALGPLPVVVDAFNRRTDGEAGGFYDRVRRDAIGRFITRRQIDQARPHRVTDLLRGAAGIELRPVLGGYTLRTTEGCTPAVFLNGVHFPLLGETIDELIPAQELEGIEVYSRAIEVPVPFWVRGTRCGAILLWARAEAF